MGQDAPVEGRPRHRVLLCCSTAGQFAEMLRVGRFLERTGELESFFWIQLPPVKLAEAAAVCEREGFHFIPSQLPTPGAPESPGVPKRKRVLRDALRALRETPSAPDRWLALLRAVIFVGLLRLLHISRLASGLFGPIRRLIPAPGAASRKSRPRASFSGGQGPRLPRPLRRLPALLFLALDFVSDHEQFVSLMSVLRGQRERIRSARRILDELRPDLIVVPEDSLYDYVSFVAEGRRRRLPTAVVPYTISTAAEPAETIVNLPEFGAEYALGSWAARFVAWLLPQWVYHYRGHDILRLPLRLILAYEYLGLAPPEPWVFNSGFSVALGAESEHMASLLVREGLSPDYVILTGAFYDDVAAEASRHREDRRRAILEELGLAHRPRLVVCSLPPRMEIDRRPGCEFGSYEQIVEFMLAPLTSLDSAVLVSLHPTLNADELRYLENEGIRISMRNIAELLGCCDVFVASISATIRIAIASGIPVINYDVFRYGYHDYDSAGGVVTVSDRASYLRTLERLRRDPAYLAELQSAQRAVAARWGFRDGKSSEALVDLFKHLIAHKSPRGYRSPRERDHGRSSPGGP